MIKYNLFPPGDHESFPPYSLQRPVQSPEMPLVDLACTGMLSSSRRDQLNTQLLIKPKKREERYSVICLPPQINDSFLKPYSLAGH